MNRPVLVSVRGHEEAIRELFWSSMLLGYPLPIDIQCADEYESLALGWYLEMGRGSACVAVLEGRVVGYCLFCPDSPDYSDDQRKRTLRLVGAIVRLLARGRLSASSARFYWSRLRDAVTIWRSRRRMPLPAGMHAHMNVHHGFHSGNVSLALRGFADRECRLAGSDVYFGEMNAMGGSRVAGLRRVGGDVIDVSRNRTFSWLAGGDVNRVTLLRHVNPEQEYLAG